jgi:hypothetical protein
VREGHTFRKQYFDAHKSDDKHRMKQRARRHLLSKKRSEIPEKQAWRDILRILEQHSPADAEHYIKRMETIRLPEGIFAQWIRDPGESILEVMQRTGSHVQVKPTKEIGHFSSITLLGTPSQNAAAKKLLQESDLLSAISEDDLNASKSLADYNLHSEIGGRGRRTGRRARRLRHVIPRGCCLYNHCSRSDEGGVVKAPHHGLGRVFQGQGFERPHGHWNYEIRHASICDRPHGSNGSADG